MPGLTVGDIEVTALSDGEFITGPRFFGPEATFAGHEAMLNDDGKLHLPIGCFLLRGGPLGGRTVLVDAGVGAVSNSYLVGGELPAQLRAAGVAREEIDTVVCSHLHLDHCGWLVDGEGRPMFPSATVWAGAADWRRFVDEEADMMLDHVRAGLRDLAEAGKVELVDADRVVAPGVSTLAAPGHTPGHVAIVVADGPARALLLGDAITCPLQLDETDWAAMSDVDAELAGATRRRLWDELEAPDTLGAGAHFPGLQFGRVLAGEGRRYWS